MSTFGIPNVAPALEATLVAQMAQVESLLLSHTRSEYPFVDETAHHLVAAGGKRLRPLLTLLTAQYGDPTGSGMGGPGYEFVNETSDLTFDKAGVVAMANAGPNTNGSQFFITFAPQEYLNGGYTIFGQIVSGRDVVTAITLRNPQQNPSTAGDAMESVTITIE